MVEGLSDAMAKDLKKFADDLSGLDEPSDFDLDFDLDGIDE